MWEGYVHLLQMPSEGTLLWSVITVMPVNIIHWYIHHLMIKMISIFLTWQSSFFQIISNNLYEHKV